MAVDKWGPREKINHRDVTTGRPSAARPAGSEGGGLGRGNLPGGGNLFKLCRTVQEGAKGGLYVTEGEVSSVLTAIRCGTGVLMWG